MAVYSESWLQLETASGGRVALSGNASEMRQQFAGLFADLSPNYPPATDVLSIIEGAHESIKYRVYIPKNTTPDKLLPIGIYTHGGGFLLGDLETEDFICRELVEQTNTIIVSVDYRLSPNHHYPAQLSDTIKILEWANSNARSFGGDADQFFTIGTSAGASLALISAREIASGRTSVNPECLRGVVAISPFTAHPDYIPQEYRSDYTSYDELGDTAPVISRAVMSKLFRYANMDPRDPGPFLLLDKSNLHRFPPVYIATASCDPLRDDGQVFASALREAGVTVRERIYQGLPHCLWFFSTLPEWAEFIHDTVAAIQFIVGTSKATK